MNSDHFALERKISESATTTVYCARQTALDRRVLLKVLQKHLASDAAFAARFQREARACASLHSPHIVQVYDLTEVDGIPAIVMQFVEGKSLKDLLADGGKQSTEVVRQTAGEVLEALSVAHAAGIIHRDIKPANILMNDAGSIMVTDFGLASSLGSPTVTLDGMVLGTPAYMSPEQIRGEILDARTDLFSLGVTLVELLTSVRTFDGASPSECMKRILEFDLKELEALLAGIPPDFAEFLRRLLHPRRNERFSSAGDALRFLTAGTQPVRAAPGRPMRRVTFAAAVVFTCAIVGFVILFRGKGRQPERVSATQPTVALSADTTMAVHPGESQAAVPRREETFLAVPERISRSGKKSVVATIRSTNDSGDVSINCTPWAMVYIDNVFIGQTPLPKPVRRTPGPAAITFSNPLFDPITRTIVITRDSQTVVEENFYRHAGYISVRAKPWAEVYIDDQYRGTTPLEKPLVASAGNRRIKFHNPMYEDASYDVDIRLGDTVRLSQTFSEKKR